MAAEEIKKNKGEESNSLQSSLLMYLHDLIYMIAIVMVVFMLLFRIVIVSGTSMYSTLYDGDWLLVTGSVLYKDPQVGDIIVASKDSFNDGEPIIKRVIATEGQTVDIDFEAGIVYVDGVALQEDYTYTPTNVQEGNAFPITIADGCIFVMGDNRNNSRDSRHPDIGMIDTREVLGKAIFLMFPGVAEDTDSRDFDRIGALK
jgi:signal peptidase I